MENDVDKCVSADSRRVETGADGEGEGDIAGSGEAGAGNGGAARATGDGDGVNGGDSRAGAAGNGGAASVHGLGDVKQAIDSVGGRVGADGVGGLKVASLDQVRISLLWRAITFRDEREAHAYDEHEDDLDVETALSRFCDDLTERGIDFTPPQDPFDDQAWSTLLTQTYLVSAFV